MHYHALHEMNHWICRVETKNEHHNALVSEAGTDFGELGEAGAEEAEMVATYMSTGVTLIKTVADGACGIDVMCMILEKPRTDTNRNWIRGKLANYCSRHMGNRAFVSMFSQLGEFKVHLGLHNLARSGRRLFGYYACDAIDVFAG